MKTIKLEDDEEYVAVEQISNKDVVYLYLANIKDENDICVRKKVEDTIMPLEDEKEFQKAMILFAKKNKELMKYLLNQ